MPRSFNGCGTMYCGYSAAIQWTKPDFISPELAEHDAVVCVTLFMLPLIPLRACHVYDHAGTVCRELPLRWSRELLLRTFLRPWAVFLTAIGGVGTALLALLIYMFIYAPPTNPRPGAIWFMLAFAFLLPAGLFANWFLNRRDRRNRDIRLVLGRHALGSSDPALWAPEVMVKASEDSTRMAMENLLEAARRAFEIRNYPEAMLGARLLVAHGSRVEGEALTDQILLEPSVYSYLPLLRREPWKREEWLAGLQIEGSLVDPAPTTNLPAVTGNQIAAVGDLLFYDGRSYSRQALNDCGGPGYADRVASHPTLVMSAPHHWVLQWVLAGFAAFFLLVAIFGLQDSNSKDQWEGVLGTAIFVGAFGYLFWQGRGQRVILGEGRLWVGASRGQETLVDAITGVRRRRWVGLFPIVAVQTVGGELSWPAVSESDEIEHAIQVFLKLRVMSDGKSGAVANTTE